MNSGEPRSWWFAVLGPVRVGDADSVLDLGARQVRLIAALLMVRAGRPVRTDELVALLWADDPPAQAANIVHRHIGALRRAFEPGLTARQEGRWLTRQDNGYALQVDSDNLDLLRFRRLGEEAALAAAEDRGSEAVKLYLEALRLWKDRCAAGLDPSLQFAPEFAAIDHERASVACAAADACLELGEAAEVLPELRAVAAESPLDEALQARLLLVLAGAGRQAEAVQRYHALRTRLAEELGVDPGAELRSAFDRVLRQEVLKEAGEPAPPGPAPTEPVPAQLPPSTRFFQGRLEEIATLDGLLPRVGAAAPGVVTVAVDGLPGVGKTCLVVHWAHRVVAHFPDGQLYVNLRGFDNHEDVVDPGQALSRLINALGVAYPEIPQGLEAKSSLYRSLMAGRRMLVILDNARDVDQVRPLIPATAGCFVVVTSRNRLTGLLVQDGAHLLNVQVPSLEEARASLQPRIGSGAGDTDAAAVDEILRRCGRLPLAIAIVGARAMARPGGGLRDIAAELGSGDPLDALDGGEPSADLRTVFSWSYRLLSSAAARLFRLLSMHPGPDVGVATTASLAAESPRDAQILLDELARSMLLTEVRNRRYAFHDLIRAYAAELATEVDTRAVRDEAAARVFDHLQQTAWSASRTLGPPALPVQPPAPRAGVTVEHPGTVAAAIDWFAREQYVLEAAVEHPLSTGPGSWQLAEALMPYFQRRGMHEPWARMSALALRSAQTDGDELGQAHMHRMLAGAKAFARESDPAIDHLTEALRLFAQLGRETEQAYVHTNLGWVRYRQGEYTDSLRHYRRAGELFARHDDRRGEGMASLGRGYVHSRLDEPAEALGCLTRAAAIFAEVGDADGGGSAAGAMADVCVALGREEEALGWRRKAVELFEIAGNAVEYARACQELGDDHLRDGRPEAARAAWRSALAAFRDVGDLDRSADVELQLSRLPRQ